MAVALRLVQKTIFVSFDNIDWQMVFVSTVWFSFLKGFLNDAARSAYERLLKDEVANCLSFSEALEPEARLALAARSLPQSSTKSITGVKPAEMFSGISLTTR